MKKQNKKTVSSAERARDKLSAWIDGYRAGRNNHCLEITPVEEAKIALDALIYESGGEDE